MRKDRNPTTVETLTTGALSKPPADEDVHEAVPEEDWEKDVDLAAIREENAKEVLDRKGHGKSLPALVRILRRDLGFDLKDAARLSRSWMMYGLGKEA